MKKYIALLLLVVVPMGIIAQQRTLNKAEKNFKKQSYISAMMIYERLAEKGMGSEQLYERLGDANYFNANYVKAAQWYSKRYALKGTFPDEFLYRYSQSLKSAGKDKQAQKIVAQYAQENPGQLRSKNLNQNLAQQSIKKGSDVFTIKNININSKYSDYSSAMKGDTLIFASARPRTTGNQIYARTGQPFTNLYYSIKQRDGNYSTPDLYSKTSFSIFHEASPVLTNDGNTMYYTQNEVKQNRQKRAIDGLYKIYKAVKQNGKWKSLGVQDIFAKDSARVAHAALSPDEKTLYFTSDAQGSFGQSDIFKVTVNEDGSYTSPENLGNTINTEGRESYPFVTTDNILIFASDGHPGQGGLDIFAFDLSQKGALPVHLNAPVNSPFDDFGLQWDRITNKGVFTSNRPKGQGDDDLYAFTNNNPSFDFDYNATMTGKVLNKANNNPIPNAIVVLYNYNGKELARTKANESGEFVFEKVRSNATYRTQATLPTYINNETATTPTLYERNLSTTIFLDQDQYKIEKGLDLAKALSLRNIYFDLGKWNIRTDTRIELEKIITVMQDNPSIKIEIGSHTDSRQSKQYNQQLSQKRAQSTLNYLVKRGINKKRLTVKGYGESQLVNQCADGIKCSEQEHEQNRRSSFIIVN